MAWSSGLTILLAFALGTRTCTMDFCKVLCFHGVMKAALRISIKHYHRKKNLKVLLFRPPYPSRGFLVQMNGAWWPAGGGPSRRLMDWSAVTGILWDRRGVLAMVFSGRRSLGVSVGVYAEREGQVFRSRQKEKWRLLTVPDGGLGELRVFSIKRCYLAPVTAQRTARMPVAALDTSALYQPSTISDELAPDLVDQLRPLRLAPGTIFLPICFCLSSVPPG
jgi:hypothetical protein